MAQFSVVDFLDEHLAVPLVEQRIAIRTATLVDAREQLPADARAAGLHPRRRTLVPRGAHTELADLEFELVSIRYNVTSPS